MDRSAVVLALACTLGVSGCLRARGTPEEPVVVDVRFEGVRAVDPGALQDKLATHPSGRWYFSEVYRLDPDALAADLRRIEAFYRARGFYEARVVGVDQIPEAGNRGRVAIVIKVSEGRPVRVTRLVVKGLEAAPEAQARAGRLPLHEGDVFTESAYDATRSHIAAALANTGWATAQVTQSAVVIPELSLIHI